MGLDFPDCFMKIFGYERVKDMTVPSTLPNDVCRCHDEDCAERNECRRYTERNKGTGERIPHCESLYIVCEGECANYIAVEVD